MSVINYSNWQDNFTITTLKVTIETKYSKSENIFIQDAAKPVADLPFPSVTICSPGLNMEAVEEAIIDDFEHWLSENKTDADGRLEDLLNEFMEEKYATAVATENIFDKIKGMSSPPTEKESNIIASAVLQNSVACKERNSEEEEIVRKKRSNEGRDQSRL